MGALDREGDVLPVTTPQLTQGGRQLVQTVPEGFGGLVVCSLHGRGRTGGWVDTELSLWCHDYYCLSLPLAVVLSGVVRRLGRTKEGLPTMTLRVKTVLRGEGDGIESGDKLEVRILSGNDTTKRLHRGKSVILSGVPVMGSQQRIIYVMDTLILDYSAHTERAINDC